MDGVDGAPRKRSSSARPRIQSTMSANGADYSANTLDAKVVILGRQGVGKTSLVRRYTSNTFHPPSTQSTTGAFFVTKKCTVDGVGVRLQIWDTAGQERFRSMAPMYIRGANAAIVVYDLTNERSFEDVRMWIDELKKSTPPTLLLYVVGSKSDLCPVSRSITPTHARASLSRWYPPPLPPTPLTHTPPSRPSPPNKRQRLISLPALPVSRSSPALNAAAVASGSGSGWVSHSGPPTPGQHTGAPRRPRLVSSPSSPTAHTNGHSHPHSLPQPQYRHRHNSSLAPPPLTAARPKPLARPWSWGSSPDEKDELTPTTPRRRAPPAEERGEYSSSDTTSGAAGDIEEESPSDEDDDSDREHEERGNWRLFEVSAKDDTNVQMLFTHLIRALLGRRREINWEHEVRRRGSVMLRGSDSGGEAGDGGAGAGGKGEDGAGRGWGCCGI